MIEEHKKETLDIYKKFDSTQQHSNERYEDLTNKVLNILCSEDRLSNHLPGNIGRPLVPQLTNDENVTRLPRTSNNTASEQVVGFLNNESLPCDPVNQFNPELIPNVIGQSNTNTNIPVLRAIGVTAIDRLLPSNRPHVPIITKKFPESFVELYEEYYRLGLSNFEAHGSKRGWSVQQQNLFSKRQRAIQVYRILQGKYRPPKSQLEVATILDQQLKVSHLTITNFLKQLYNEHVDVRKRKRT